jgi:glyoxylase I family protein
VKVTLHHVNLCSTGVPAMDKFYREIMDLEPNPTLNANRDTSQGYDGAVAFLDAGDIQFHLATRDLDIAFKRGHAINPLEKGHIAFRTDDIEAFKKRLEDNGIPYADYGKWAMGGWHQIFFQDPEGNIIEVHQADA